MSSEPPTSLSETQILSMKEQEKLCAACENPCHVDLLDYPKNFVDKITTDEVLLGTTKAHRWHVLLCSGVSGKKWPSHLEAVEDSYAAVVSQVVVNLRDILPGRPLVSTISTPSEDGVDAEFECDIIIFPEAVKYKAVRREQVEAVFRQHMIGVVEGEVTEPLPVAIPLEKKCWVFICGHKLRDNRCGIAAPLLVDAFEKIVEEKNIDDKVAIDVISHIGGHKFAGNVIIQTGVKGLGAVWYGRVFPYHVNAIVEKTIQNNIVLQPLLRYRSESPIEVEEV